MTHISTSDLDRMREGLAGGAEVRAIGLHLQLCAECAERARAVFEGAGQALSEAFRASVEDDDSHIDEDLPAYVDGLLDDDRYALVERHIRGCRSCREEAADLRSWSRMVEQPPSRFAKWAGLAAAAAAVLIVVLQIRHDPTRRTDRHSPDNRPVTLSAAPSPAHPSSSRTARTPRWQRLVDDTIRTGQLPLSREITRFATSDTYRGANADTQQTVHPSGTAIVEEQPTFEWPAIAGAEYVVSVVAVSNGEVVAQSGRLKTPRWSCSSELVRGKVYRWQVDAQRGGESMILPAPPAPPALFRVIAWSQKTELDDAERQRPNDHLLLAILYARAGVVEGARKHLERCNADECDSQVVRRLLAQLPAGRVTPG
jgi:anti-sigma factor RsiW